MKLHGWLWLFCALRVAALAADSSSPANPGAFRKDLLSATISPEKSISHVEIKEVTLVAKQKVPLHSHPCPVVGVVAEGRIAFQIEGEAVKYLGPGDAFYEPANARVARFDNEGDSNARFTAFYLLGAEDKEIIRILTR